MLKKQLHRELVASFRTVKTFFFSLAPTPIIVRTQNVVLMHATFVYIALKLGALANLSPKIFLQFRENSLSCASTILCQPFHVILPCFAHQREHNYRRQHKYKHRSNQITPHYVFIIQIQRHYHV
jgi:hypothetical protein